MWRLEDKMAKPMIDQAAAAKIRTDIQSARDGLITDRTDALVRVCEALLRALEDAK